jgi:competence protein ComEC|tara:strand:- start:399 stop:1199 length:801 start_codon:yes stop_codon:yes gene_type:complete
MIGIFGLVMVSIIGYLLAQSDDDRFDATHINQYLDEVTAFSGWIADDPVERENRVRYVLELDSLMLNHSKQKVNGRILLYVYNNLNIDKSEYGDYLYVIGDLNPITAPKNPETFDYQLYFSRQHVYHQSFVADSLVYPTGVNMGSYFRYGAFIIRNKAQEIIQNTLLDDRERAVLMALLLGKKDDLTPELTDAYAASGAINVLAVSGLHIGIVFLLLHFLFRWLHEIPYGFLIYAIILLMGLWLYAMVAGLSQEQLPCFQFLPYER